MGVFDYVSDLYAALAIQTAEAEEPAAENSEEESNDAGDDVKEEEAPEEEEEDEEEEEPEDIKPKLEEECLSKSCAGVKHHYDECAERVLAQEEKDGKASEDCVEEYFHMMHCATQCAAPKLFKSLR